MRVGTLKTSRFEPPIWCVGLVGESLNGETFAIRLAMHDAFDAIADTLYSPR